jgi:hypothetical protein
MAAFLSGDRLVVGHYSFLRVLDGRMKTTLDLDSVISNVNCVSSLAASDDSI